MKKYITALSCILISLVLLSGCVSNNNSRKIQAEKSLNDGTIYFEAQEYQKAFKCFAEGAKKGSLESEAWLGICYFYGFGIKRQPQQGTAIFKDAARKGNVTAMYGLGKAYLKGKGVPKNPEEGIRWIRKSLEVQYDPETAAEMSSLYAAEGNWAEAENWLEKAAEKGDLESLKNAGRKYAKTNPQKALRFLRAAADKGDIESMFLTGDIMCSSKYDEKTFIQGTEYLKQAAEKGNIDACYTLAFLYWKGNGVDEDIKKASYLFRKAAEGGKKEAQYEYGMCCYNGEGMVKPDYKSSFMWLEKSAKSGYPLGKLGLALCYWKGAGTLKDLEKAASLAEESRNDEQNARYPDLARIEGAAAVLEAIRKEMACI